MHFSEVSGANGGNIMSVSLILRWLPIALFLAPSPSMAQQADQLGENPERFFLFHATDVSFEQARADYNYCIDQAKVVRAPRDLSMLDGGLLGNAIGGAIADKDRLRIRNAVMRKCMALHGYARYGVPPAMWNAIVNEGDIVLDNKGQVDPIVTERLAKFASGPQPTGARLVQ